MMVSYVSYSTLGDTISFLGPQINLDLFKTKPLIAPFFARCRWFSIFQQQLEHITKLTFNEFNAILSPDKKKSSQKALELCWQEKRKQNFSFIRFFHVPIMYLVHP